TGARFRCADRGACPPNASIRPDRRRTRRARGRFGGKAKCGARKGKSSTRYRAVSRARGAHGVMGHQRRMVDQPRASLDRAPRPLCGGICRGAPGQTHPKDLEKAGEDRGPRCSAPAQTPHLVSTLRYACQFFASLFDGRKQAMQRRRFSKILKNLQGSLGNLNDIEVHKRLAATVAHPRKRPRKQAVKAMAMGFIAGQEHLQIASCIAGAKKAGEQLSDLPKFWK